MSLQLVILGLLSGCHSHPYEIKKLLKEHQLDRLIKVNDGTLYYAIEVLSKKGSIEPLEVVQADKRPEKTIYGITEAGKGQLEEEIYAGLTEDGILNRSFIAALLFVKYADRHKVIDLIESRTRAYEAKLAEVTGTLSVRLKQSPDSSLFILQNTVLHIQTEYEWLQRLSEAARNGDMTNYETPFHTSNAMQTEK